MLVAGRCSEWSCPLAASLSGQPLRPQTGLLKPPMMTIITVIRSSCRGNLFWKTPSWVLASLADATTVAWETTDRQWRKPKRERDRGGGKREKKTGGERPPNPPNVTPVSSSPTSCHLPNALGFIFLIDTLLSYSISIFRLSFCVHHSLPSLAEPSASPHVCVSLQYFFWCFSLSLVSPIPHPLSNTTPGFCPHMMPKIADKTQSCFRGALWLCPCVLWLCSIHYLLMDIFAWESFSRVLWYTTNLAFSLRECFRI